jgi:hypothetical protein
VTVAVLTAHSQHVSGPAITWLIREAGQTVLVIQLRAPGRTPVPADQIDTAGRLARPQLPSHPNCRSR